MRACYCHWKSSCSGSLTYDLSTAKAIAGIYFHACQYRTPSYGRDQMCASGIQTCPTSTLRWPSRVPAGLTLTAWPSWSCRSVTPCHVLTSQHLHHGILDLSALICHTVIMGMSLYLFCKMSLSMSAVWARSVQALSSFVMDKVSRKHGNDDVKQIMLHARLPGQRSRSWQHAPL